MMVSMSTCIHSPSAVILSDRGALYLVVTATVADSDTGSSIESVVELL